MPDCLQRFGPALIFSNASAKTRFFAGAEMDPDLRRDDAG
jgi:hypothetical protein